MVVLQTVVGIVLLVIVVVLAWSAIEPYSIDRQTLEITLPGLPDAWDGRVVAIIADTQVGLRLADTATIRHIVAELVERRPAVVLTHHPDSFEALVPSTAPLAVAGHTHGGQFRTPFTPHWTWMTFTEDEPFHRSGGIPDFGAEGNRLCVNRGIGFSVLPLRSDAPPEVTYLTLRRSATESPGP